MRNQLLNGQTDEELKKNQTTNKHLRKNDITDKKFNEKRLLKNTETIIVLAKTRYKHKKLES